MNYKARTAALSLALLLTAYAPGKDKPKDAVINLQGSITDSQCAYNVHSDAHSHEWMIKRGVQDATDDKSCTLHCVKDMGGAYVLVVKKDIYRLDDQVKAEMFAGKNVKASGTLDAKTHTLHVYEIEEDK
jgi:anti-sigma-K factor RskA